MTRIATHNGTFHADDVFAVAALRLLPEFNEAEIIRTRIDNEIETADIRVDVGGKNDPSTGDFDHHMREGAGIRNGVPYAAFGLVWKHYGNMICGNSVVAEKVEKRLVMPIDDYDNGVRPGDGTYHVSRAIKSLNRDWDFALELATRILNHEIGIAKQEVRGEKIVSAALEWNPSPHVLLLNESCRWDHYVAKNVPGILLVVYPSVSGPWYVQSVFKKEVQKTRYLPEVWAGLKGEEFAKISGIDDALFCDHKRYLAAAKSREGALKLAALALEPGEIPIDLEEIEKIEQAETIETRIAAKKAGNVIDSLFKLLHIK